MITNRDNRIGNGQLLPPGWERAYDTKSNRYFYVDHNNQSTTWLNPMDERTKPKSVSECYDEGQLPYGWERMDSSIGVYYADHISRRNQWTNPVSDWRQRMSQFNQHHYSNSHHLLSLEQPGNSLDSNIRTISPMTTSKPDISLQTSDDNEVSATSLNNSTTLDTEIINSTQSNTSTRGSKYDEGLVNIMDNCFGRESSQSVEV